MNSNAPMAPGTHVLPPLPYAYNALEPIIDEETMKIHHDKHHKKYVDDLNKAELEMVKVREKGDYEYVSHWANGLAFNGSGHTLHSIFWTVMIGPGEGGEPREYTRSHIDWYFGGLDKFKAEFIATANAVQGSGWCILGYNPAFRRLELLQCEKHQNLTQWGIIPILVLDVWEHAYYLKYKNERTKFVENFWQIINWEEVEKRLLLATQGVLPLEMTQEKIKF